MSTDKQQKRYGIDVIGIYLDQIRTPKKLSLEEEKDLVEKARTDEKAREKLLLYTLWVVPAALKRFNENNSSLDFVDLIGEGNYGLVKAVKSLHKFKGESKFSTYAGRVVINEMLDYIKREKRKRIKLSLDDLKEEPLTDNKFENPLTEAGKNELIENLEAAVAKLSPAEKSFLKAMFVEDKNPNEIAHSNNRTKLFLYRKRERIFNKLKKDKKLKTEIAA